VAYDDGMRNDSEGFLQRIRAFPDDDVPRLIYADWLDEQNDARGEFIRIQIALSRLPLDDRRRSPLVAEEQRLLARHEAEWKAPFHGLASVPDFRRGFVEEVKIAARQYLAHADELFGGGPIRHIHLLDVGSSLRSVLESHYLGRLSALTIYAQHAGELLARELSRCPHLANLRSLNLGRNRLTDEAIVHLAGSSTLSAVQRLDLAENEIGERGARALANSSHLGQLEFLELRANRLGPTGAEALATSSSLDRLQSLGLSQNLLGQPRVQQLPGLAQLQRARTLDLTGNQLTGDMLAVLLLNLEEHRLRDLDLSQNALGVDGARVVATAESLGELRTLRLANNQIGDDGARLLAASRSLPNLQILDIGNNPLSDAGLRPFLDPKALPSLRTIIAPGIGISSAMRQALDARLGR